MQVQEIMSKKVICFKPVTTVYDAIHILVENKISGAPVLDEKGKLAGIVSAKDLMVTLDFLGMKTANKTTVADFMTREVITFASETPVEEVSQVLVRKNIKRAPIVKGDKVVGVVSRGDILRWAKQNWQK